MKKGSDCRSGVENAYRLVRPWIILVFCCVETFITGGTIRSFGVFVNHIKNEYGSRLTLLELDFIVDLQMSLTLLLIPATIIVVERCRDKVREIYPLAIALQAALLIAGYLTTSYNREPALWFLTYSLLTSVGFSILVGTGLAMMSEQFAYRSPVHVLATTLTVSGPMGAPVMCAIQGHLCHTIGWRATLRYTVIAIGAPTVFGVVASFGRKMFGAPYADILEQAGLAEETESAKTLKSVEQKSAWDVLRLPMTYAWFACCAIHQAVTMNLLFNLPRYFFMKYDLDKTNYVNMIFFGAGTALMQVCVAGMGNFVRGYFRFAALLVALLCMFVILMWYAIPLQLGGDYAFCFIIGFALHGNIAPAYAMGEEIMNIEGHWGFTIFCVASFAGIVAAPLTSGLLIDNTGFRYFFVLQAGLCLLETLVYMVVLALTTRRRNQAGKEELQRIKHINNKHYLSLDPS